MCLHHLPDPPRLHLVDPARHIDAPRNRLALQPPNILPDLVLEHGESEEIQMLHLLRRRIPLVLLHQPLRRRVIESQHAAPRVLDDQHIGRAEQLLRDDQRAEGVVRRGAGVADDVGCAEGDAEGGGRVDARVHAGHCASRQLGRHQGAIRPMCATYRWHTSGWAAGRGRPG